MLFRSAITFTSVLDFNPLTTAIVMSDYTGVAKDQTLCEESDGTTYATYGTSIASGTTLTFAVPIAVMAGDLVTDLTGSKIAPAPPSQRIASTERARRSTSARPSRARWRVRRTSSSRTRLARSRSRSRPTRPCARW